MLFYKQKNKRHSRSLRTNLTEAEVLLWSRVRRQQIAGIQFYRQKPIGNYIVDFYAPAMKLVIEIDGDQHYEDYHQWKDKMRDDYLKKLGLKVLRFGNEEVLRSIDVVLEVICYELP